MALNIKDPQTHAIARELAQVTGEGITKAVHIAILERLQRVRPSRIPQTRSLADTLDEIALRCAALPDVDTRSPDEIIGYDEYGLPH